MLPSFIGSSPWLMSDTCDFTQGTGATCVRQHRGSHASAVPEVRLRRETALKPLNCRAFLKRRNCFAMTDLQITEDLDEVAAADENSADFDQDAVDRRKRPQMSPRGSRCRRTRPGHARRHRKRASGPPNAEKSEEDEDDSGCRRISVRCGPGGKRDVVSFLLLPRSDTVHSRRTGFCPSCS